MTLNEILSKVKSKLEGEYNLTEVDVFLCHIKDLWDKVDRSKKPVNQWWLSKKDSSFFTGAFKTVKSEKMLFDGKHIVLQNTGVSYDYIAYKNKMLMIYPETTIALSEAYEGDSFSFEQENGKVDYKHTFSNPFERDPKSIIGVYCVIKNSRGEFLTILSKDEINKHRAIARTDSIWCKWFFEMALKTVIKKATKFHFSDIFEGMNEEDNKSIDINNNPDVDINLKNIVDSIKTTEALALLQKNQDAKYNQKDLNKMCAGRLKELQNENS